MNMFRKILLVTGALAALSLSARAEKSFTTVTNVVTVLVTNVVTITNVAASVPPAALARTAPAVELAKKYPWVSAFSAGLTLTRGNSHTLLYSADIGTDKKTPENEYSLGAAGAYGSQDSKDNVNNYKGFAQWNHLFTDRFYSYLRVDALRDVIADLDYRINIGPGGGYYFVKATNTTLSGEIGGGYQDEHLGGEYNSYGTIRFAEKFDHKFSDRARLFQNAEILPQADKFQNYVVNFQIGIEAAITKSFSLKTTLDDAYQSEPAAGRYRNDVKLISGVSYKF
jgi:putative salt-induced outer membrane protein YdiY